ncbi:hypothetical protein [Nocardiopsis gilva]|uniref:hypothetical protein n=1 Tax=Nocardiopsis gilva TaxID=280236 RepID=UPI003742179F
MSENNNTEQQQQMDPAGSTMMFQRFVKENNEPEPAPSGRSPLRPGGRRGDRGDRHHRGRRHDVVLMRTVTDAQH